VRAAIQRIGARLLVDELVQVETGAGPVEIVGADYLGRGRREHLSQLFDGLSPRTTTPRLLLLHDPGAFKHVPDGSADLTLSGHTHGGHLGLVSFGRDWTVVSAFSGMPDHGFWARRHNRLYVHRCTGHYGFPIRVGVPGEESVLHISWDPRPDPEETPQ